MAHSIFLRKLQKVTKNDRKNDENALAFCKDSGIMKLAIVNYDVNCNFIYSDVKIWGKHSGRTDSKEKRKRSRNAAEKE